MTCRSRWVIVQDARRWWRLSVERMSAHRMVYPDLFSDDGGYCTRCGVPAR